MARRAAGWCWAGSVLLGLGRCRDATDVKFQQPQQVHLALGFKPSEMTVQWATMQATGQDGKPPSHPGESFVMWGKTPEALTEIADGHPFAFEDFGNERRQYSMHVATMTGLEPNTYYSYVVGGNKSGWSQAFRFRAAPDAASLDARLPMTYAVYGDQGDFNGQTLPAVQAAVRRGEIDLVLHVGDMAYDMHSDDGRNGDAWMRDIEPVAAAVPYMVDQGNHEAAQNCNHYTQRFRNMPSNSGHITFPEFGTVPNNWWYSFDSGLVHFVAVSTEIYFDHPDLVPQQYAWLEEDLKAANRTRTPWLVVHGHRPLYCSCDLDCDGPATKNRMGLWKKGENGTDGTYEYGLEELLYKYGVDLYLCGHEHDYERMYDVSPHFRPVVPWLSGVSTQSSVDPPATTYIVTGAAGNVEDHEPFKRPAPHRSAKRLNSYGWSRMTVHNSTHLLWQQIGTDSGQPEEKWGQVVDETWLIQRHHGPFKDHPRRGIVEELEKLGLAKEIPAAVEAEVELETSRRLQAQVGPLGQWQTSRLGAQTLEVNV